MWKSQKIRVKTPTSVTIYQGKEKSNATEKCENRPLLIMAIENFVIHPSLISNIFNRRGPEKSILIYITLCFWKVLELPGAINIIPLPIGEPIKIREVQ